MQNTRPKTPSNPGQKSTRFLFYFSILCILCIASCSEDPKDDTPNDTFDVIAADTQKEKDSSADTTSEPQNWLSAVEEPPNMATAANGWYRGDLHYHTNYSDDAKEQGGDDLKECLDIADGYRHPDLVGAYPEYEGNSLDYIAITDHRTDAAIFDPDFKHDHLILIPGEEYGGSGHANIFGISEHIPHDIQGDETQNQRHLNAIDEAHAMGAVFSINHPVDGNNWVWDTPTVDAIEVVNGPWAAFFLGTSEEDLDADVSGGTENPFIRDAMENGGAGLNEMGLRFWENHLTAGLHVAPIGGSDRHMLVAAALPTTYIHPPKAWIQGLEKPSELAFEGIVAGIDAGHTFISRSPIGAQILMEAEGSDGVLYPMGSALPKEESFLIHVEVSRAENGLLRLVSGAIEGEKDGVVSANPILLDEVEIPGKRVKGTYLWTPPAEGGWLYAMVLEPLQVEPWPESLEVIAEELSEPSEVSGLLAMATALLPIIDPNLMLNPGLCDPGSWDPFKPQCMDFDNEPLATFYFPDALIRILNRWFEDGSGSDYCFGALSSAFMVPAE